MPLQPQSTHCSPAPGCARGCTSHPAFLLPQETSQPLNLTAKPKGSELPSASSSPSLKMSSCQSLTPSHGAVRDLQSSPSNLPLGGFPSPPPVEGPKTSPTTPPRGGRQLCSLVSHLVGVLWVHRAAPQGHVAPFFVGLGIGIMGFWGADGCPGLVSHQDSWARAMPSPKPSRMHGSCCTATAVPWRER